MGMGNVARCMVVAVVLLTCGCGVLMRVVSEGEGLLFPTM